MSRLDPRKLPIPAQRSPLCYSWGGTAGTMGATVLEFNIGPADQGLDWLQFWASVIGSAAWPIVAILIAFLFRKQIADRLANIRKVSVGEATVDMADKLDEIEADVRTDPGLAALNRPEQAPLPDDRFQRLLELSPAAAILDAWGPIELKLENLGSPYASTLGTAVRSPSTRRVMRLLLEENRITGSFYELLLELSELRNAAAHYKDVSATDAIRFQALAETAKRELNRIGER